MTEYVIKKPFGIAVLMSLLGLIGSIGSVAALVILASSVFGDGPDQVNDELVTKGEFLRTVVPFIIIYLIGCLVALSAAWGIHSEKPGSRPLLLMYSALPMSIIPVLLRLDYSALDAAFVLMPCAFLVVLAWLYLYRKRSVTQYYAALALPWRSPTRGAPAS